MAKLLENRKLIIIFLSTVCQRLDHQSVGRGNYTHLQKDNWQNYYRVTFPSTVSQRLNHQSGGRGNYSHLHKDKWISYNRITSPYVSALITRAAAEGTTIPCRRITGKITTELHSHPLSVIALITRAAVEGTTVTCRRING
jgi:hypothetical protein